MASYTKRIERFENAIFKQREEINDRMVEMFGLLKELTASRTPENILMGEEARHPITKNVNSISLIRIEEEENRENNRQVNNSVMEPGNSGDEEPPEEINMKNEAERRTDDEPANSAKKNVTKNEENEPVGVSGSHVVRGPVYKAILKKKITKKEDIRGNFEIPYKIGGLKHINALVDQGSGVNIMPLSTYEKLTNEKHSETDIRLSLAIHSYIYPLGITQDVLVDVAGHEKIKLHQEKEMKFDQWRSKIFNNERPTSIKEECEAKNKGEVMSVLCFNSHTPAPHNPDHSSRPPPTVPTRQPTRPRRAPTEATPTTKAYLILHMGERDPASTSKKRKNKSLTAMEEQDLSNHIRMDTLAAIRRPIKEEVVKQPA
ncbi:hypothetical protein Tco_0357397 [Tanacetum coccineum]